MRTLSRWIICAVSWILWRNTTAFFLVKPDLIRTPNDTQNWQSRRINLSIQQRPKRRWEILSNPGSDSKDTEEYLQDPKFVERNKRWIIIVDDEEAIRMAVGDFLYDRGYQVTACADADSMLDLLTVSDDVESTGDILLTFPDAIIRCVMTVWEHCLFQLRRRLRHFNPSWEHFTGTVMFECQEKTELNCWG